MPTTITPAEYHSKKKPFDPLAEGSYSPTAMTDDGVAEVTAEPETHDMD
jgi:hypothetical protein